MKEQKNKIKISLKKLIFILILFIIILLIGFYCLYCYLTKNNNINSKNSSNENIIGNWYPNDINAEGEEGGRSLSSYFGYKINEKNHFEFYTDGTYIKQLGDLDEKGNYEIVDNKIYMTSSLGQITILEFNTDENDINSLVEKENELIISYLKVKDEWRKINIENCQYYDNCIIKMDLNGDEQEEKIDIKSSGKYLIINGEEYVVNKKDINNDYNINQYHICDLNGDNIMEIVHRTFSNRISPITSYYTIYNFYNNALHKVSEMSFVGNIPNEIYVKDNTFKFEYWPYESAQDYKKELVLNLDLNYLD